MDIDLERMSREELEKQLRSLLYVRERVVQNAHLLQELHMQRQELQEQNRLLYEAQSDSEAARAHYAELYDFAPVSYYVFDVYGCVRSVNLTGASMLGQEREQLLGRPFALLIGVTHAQAFWTHLSQCKTRRAPVESELKLSIKRGALTVRCVSVPVLDLCGNATAFRTVFTSISDLVAARQEQQDARDAEQRLRTTHARVAQAVASLHRTMASLANLDGLGQCVADEARLLVDADQALVSLTAYPGLGATEHFSSGSLVTHVHEHQSIQQTIHNLDAKLGELRVTTRRGQGFSSDDRLRLSLFAERAGLAFEITALTWLASSHRTPRKAASRAAAASRDQRRYRLT
jgi:PAS domain S-box-containing protein